MIERGLDTKFGRKAARLMPTSLLPRALRRRLRMRGKKDGDATPDKKKKQRKGGRKGGRKGNDGTDDDDERSDSGGRGGEASESSRKPSSSRGGDDSGRGGGGISPGDVGLDELGHPEEMAAIERERARMGSPPPPEQQQQQQAASAAKLGRGTPWTQDPAYAPDPSEMGATVTSGGGGAPDGYGIPPPSYGCAHGPTHTKFRPEPRGARRGAGSRPPRDDDFWDVATPDGPYGYYGGSPYGDGRSPGGYPPPTRAGGGPPGRGRRGSPDPRTPMGWDDPDGYGGGYGGGPGSRPTPPGYGSNFTPMPRSSPQQRGAPGSRGRAPRGMAYDGRNAGYDGPYPDANLGYGGGGGRGAGRAGGNAGSPTMQRPTPVDVGGSPSRYNRERGSQPPNQGGRVGGPRRAAGLARPNT